MEGFEFDALNGKLICEKYITQATKNAMLANSRGARKKGQRRENVDYALVKHYDTAQFDYNVKRIRDMKDYLVILTEKLHGTSGRTGYVQVTREKFSRFAQVVNDVFGKRIIKPKISIRYEKVCGSRNQIVDTEHMPLESKEYYRKTCHDIVSRLLYKGETVYYEIVGYGNYGSPLMGNHSVEKLGKDAVTRFGKSIVYSYGCKLPPDNLTFDIYVYRIATQNEDGIVTEYSWKQVEKRCAELGLKTVPVLDAQYSYTKWQTMDIAVDAWTKNCPASVLDSRHIREGVVIRIESNQGIQCFKKKTYEFLVMEGLAKDKTDYIDIEEAA
jgi:hypothetical protein